MKKKSNNHLLLLLIGVGVLLGYFVWQGYRHALAAASDATRNVGEVLASRIESDFDRVDGLLGHVAQWVVSEQPRPTATSDRIAASPQLLSLIGGFDTVAGLFLFDGEGRLMLASRAVERFSVEDRPYFRQLRDDGEQQVFSDALIDRASGQMSVVQARAIRAPDGRLIGVASAVIHVDRLERHFSRLDVGRDGVVLLRRSDDFRLIQRQPRLKESDFNQPLPPDNDIRRRIEAGERGGSLRYVASTDGLDRIGSFRLLEGYPFYVQVALSADHYLAGWRRESVGALTVMLALLAGMAIFQRRLQRTERQSGELFARLEKISRNVPGVIYQFQRRPDGHTSFPYSSDGIRQIYGVEPETVREDASAVFAVLHPDDRDRVALSIERSAVSLEPWHDEYRVVLPQGGCRWVEGEATPERLGDGSVLWHGYIRDVTERRQMDERLRLQQWRLQSMIDGTHVGTWEWNVQTGETAFNALWAEIAGYTVDELMPMSFDTWAKLLHPDDLARSRSLLTKHFAGQSEFYDSEFRMRHKDGRWVWVHARGRVASRTADGKPLLMFGTHLDIDERKRAEEELERHRHRLEELVDVRTAELSAAKELAEAANRAKTAFLNNMSHELRTPMNGIMGMMELARMRMTDPKGRDQLDKARAAADRLLAVLNDILDISRIEAERMTIEDMPFTLADLIGDLDSVVAQRAAARGLALAYDLPADLASRPLGGDPGRLGQVLLNLVGNAIRFTERGSVRVRCRAEEESAGRLVVRVEVEDSGIGIDAATQQRLFRSFEQADNSTTRKYGGTGLGLAISKRLIELMGGRIGLISAPGEGSMFWFSVPLRVRAHPVPDARPDRSSEPLIQRLRELHAGRRILLAEDEPTNQEVARMLLEHAGLVVDVADDGARALELARDQAYALILMDIQMPVLNGIDATRAIRADSLNTATPILAMSANAYDVARRACIEAGMDEHLAKPLPPETLYARVLERLQSTPGAEH